MSFDNSRNSFNHWNGYSGVVMEQGRVQTDSDWNEWLAEQSRRMRAGTLDILGHAVCPDTTPNAFKIDATSSGDLRIGLGRMYVDGILVENFGVQSATTGWDPALAELSNVPQPQPSTPQPLDASNSILFETQPFNNGAAVPTGPGQYIAFLDVWQRPTTYIEDASLIDPAIGIDTTGRLQTAWRVNLLPMPAVAVQGSVTSSSGSFNSGDLVTQANTTATALVIGTVPSNGPMMLSIVSGAPDGTSVWSDPSGAQFTPTSEPAGVGSVIAGSVPSTSAAFQLGEEVVQNGSGASATLSETVPAAGPMIVGSVSGIAVSFANWMGQTSGAIFVPTALPSGSISSIQGAVSSSVPFVANEQVVQNPGGASANLIGPVPQGGPMVVGAITGTPNDSSDWVGQTSNASFTPSALPVVSGWSCSSSDYSIPWPGSSGTLTTEPTTSPKTGPCCLTTGDGYTGPENQFYRIEIHNPGGAGGAGATFKWSRENASVQTAVTAISPGTNSLSNPTNALTVQSLGRDQILGFTAGNWIELTDASHDNACLPGELYKIDHVSVPDSSIILATPLSANFSSTTISSNAYTRIIRWDQAGEVQNIESSKQVPYYNLDGTNSSAQLDGFTGIPIPSDGSAVVLEDGIAITFGLSIANGNYQAMDYWNFTARAADGSIQKLTGQPPSGIAHHYTKLSTVTIGVSSTPSTTDCRKLWPPTSSGGDCSCCCSVTVGPASGSNAQFTSIQKAIDSLHHGGEVCLEPGNYYENVLIRGTRNIVIKGCGKRTRVHSQSLQPGGGAQTADSGYTVSGFDAVFTIIASQDITIESLSITAAEEELGILMDQATAKGWSQEGNDLTYRLPDSGILLTDLEISAAKMPAIGARYTTDLTICDNRIQMKDIASLYPAVYLEGDSIRFERNLVQVESRVPVGRAPDPVIEFAAVSTQQSVKASAKTAVTGAAQLDAAKKAPMVDAVGGVQVGGPSTDIWIVENEIDGGARNGITLGSLLYLDKDGNGDGSFVGATLDLDSTCSNGGSSTIPGTHQSGTTPTPTPVAAGGRIRNLHILRNRIRDVGMCGIGPVGFFDITTTREIVSLENVLIAENILVNTLRRNVLPAAVNASPYGYGVISLPDVTNLIIRANILVNYGITPGAEVCGIYVYHGEGVEIDSNQIRETRDLSGFLDQRYATYSGRRAGIYIDAVTPPTLDTSADSSWAKAAGRAFKLDANDSFRIQLPNYAPGFPALRIENNTVRVAFGLALSVEGTGPYSILGNHFATGGTVVSDDPTMKARDTAGPDPTTLGSAAGALTVSILNLGFSLEIYDVLALYLDMIQSSGNLTLNQLGSALATLAAASGTILFANNICQLVTQLNSVRGTCSVGVLTLDSLLFNNNQLWINGQIGSAFTDALLIGISVQTVSNRLEESALSVACSGLSFGVVNVNAQNVSSFAFPSFPGSAPNGISTPNVVFFP
jgi:hypothetical protein